MAKDWFPYDRYDRWTFLAAIIWKPVYESFNKASF